MVSHIITQLKWCLCSSYIHGGSLTLSQEKGFNTIAHKSQKAVHVGREYVFISSMSCGKAGDWMAWKTVLLLSDLGSKAHVNENSLCSWNVLEQVAKFLWSSRIIFALRLQENNNRVKQIHSTVTTMEMIFSHCWVWALKVHSHTGNLICPDQCVCVAVCVCICLHYYPFECTRLPLCLRKLNTFFVLSR